MSGTNPAQTAPGRSPSRARLVAVLIGAALAVGCRLVPDDYRSLCEAVASVCLGSISP